MHRSNQGDLKAFNGRGERSVNGAVASRALAVITGRVSAVHVDSTAIDSTAFLK